MSLNNLLKLPKLAKPIKPIISDKG